MLPKDFRFKMLKSQEKAEITHDEFIRGVTEFGELTF
jgi:hypothetical protein